MNLLHDLQAGNKDEMTVIVEIPRGSMNKYEIDKGTGLIALDRVNHTAQAYPFDYGFVPQTLWDDGDALDVILITSSALMPGILVKARPVGIMRMVDGGEPDDKVIAVPAGDPRWKHVQDIENVNEHFLKEIRHFFTTYKQLQDKEVKVGEFEDKKAAQGAFERASKMYGKNEV